MKKVVITVGLAVVALSALAAVAVAASGWVANPGSSYSGGIVTLTNDGSGTSYENPALNVPVKNGDTITFEWRSDDVACAGGVPRVFIQGGAYNTFDADPAGPGACGTPLGDGWFKVTGTISGAATGPAGYTGIVNDNPADPGTIQVRNLVIAGVSVLPISNADGCKKDGWKADGYKNQGQCVSSFAKVK
jgi:hypothetical protein